MEDMQDELDRLYDRLGSLSKSLRSASDELNKGLVSQQTQDAIEKDIVQRTAEVQKILEELDKLLGQGNTSLAVTEQGIGSLNQSLATLDGMKLKRIRKMKSAEKEGDICIVGGGIWKRKWSDSGGGWQRRYHRFCRCRRSCKNYGFCKYHG